MVGPEIEQFGITQEEFDSIYARKKRMRDFTFAISSAVGIIGGCIYGIYVSNTLYETFLFILFFGCFLGSLFGAVFTIIVKLLNILLLYIFSPAYRNCRKYLSAKSRAGSRTVK